MSARILAFKSPKEIHGQNGIYPLSSSGAINVEVPPKLAQQIADAAIWEGKTPQQFVLAFLQAAFPERAGSA